MDNLPYEVLLNNVFVKNIYSLFVHNYDLDGFLNLKLVNKKFYKLLNEDKIYKEIFNIKKYIFFVDTFEEYKRDQLSKTNPRLDYKLRVLYKVAKVNTWYFPLRLKNAFNGYNNIIKLPVKYNISHKVLDGFSRGNYWKNMYFKMRHPIMRGVDTLGRNFLLFKYYDLTNKKEIIEIFFNNKLYYDTESTFELKEYIYAVYLSEEIEHDYWEFNGKFNNTYLGDHCFEYKKNVREVTFFNCQLIKKLLNNKTVNVNTRYYDDETESLRTDDCENYVELTLDRLEYVNRCINGLSGICARK
jgi:hypothetical protein